MAATAKEPIWMTRGSEKRTRVRRMFTEIAPTYDLLNAVMSVNSHDRWRSKAVATLALNPGDRVLDVCCGTGSFVTPLRKAVTSAGTVLGLDFSDGMLRVAADKRSRDARFLNGDALSLPVASNAFAGVTVGWGLRNVADLDRAHAEVFRVLKPGGRFVSLDMATPQNGAIGMVSRTVFHCLVPLLGRIFRKSSAYTYLPESTERFASREMLGASMRGVGFEDIGWSDFMFGNICMHWGVKP